MARCRSCAALASYFAGQGGKLWAAEHDGRVAGMVGTRPIEDGAWEICRMYLATGERGTGLAQRLLDTAEAHAKAGGCRAPRALVRYALR